MERSGVLQALSMATGWESPAVVNSSQQDLLGVIDME